MIEYKNRTHCQNRDTTLTCDLLEYKQTKKKMLADNLSKIEMR